MGWLRKLFSPLTRPSSPALKTPVKITVSARKVLADGSLGEVIKVSGVTVKEV